MRIHHRGWKLWSENRDQIVKDGNRYIRRNLSRVTDQITAKRIQGPHRRGSAPRIRRHTVPISLLLEVRRYIVYCIGKRTPKFINRTIWLCMMRLSRCSAGVCTGFLHIRETGHFQPDTRSTQKYSSTAIHDVIVGSLGLRGDMELRLPYIFESLRNPK